MRARLTNRFSWGDLRIAACALSLLMASCGTSPKKPEKPGVVAPVYVGTVSIVNREAHYVLIDLSGTTAPPAAGTELTAIAPSGDTSQLKVTPERKAPFVAANIVSGEPRKGQRVYR